MSDTYVIAHYVRAEPKLLALSRTPAEQLALDDALIAAGIDLGVSIGWERGEDRYDIASGANVLPVIAQATLGRPPEVLLEIDGVVPFALEQFPHSANFLSALETTLPTLPGFVPGAGCFRFFGNDEVRGPYLWISHEVVGAQMKGLLYERQWVEWSTQFEHATASWPRRW